MILYNHLFFSFIFFSFIFFSLCLPEYSLILYLLCYNQGYVLFSPSIHMSVWWDVNIFGVWSLAPFGSFDKNEKKKNNNKVSPLACVHGCEPAHFTTTVFAFLVAFTFLHRSIDAPRWREFPKREKEGIKGLGA